MNPKTKTHTTPAQTDDDRPANPGTDDPPRDEHGNPDNGKPFDADKDQDALANAGKQDVK